MMSDVRLIPLASGHPELVVVAGRRVVGDLLELRPSPSRRARAAPGSGRSHRRPRRRSCATSAFSSSSSASVSRSCPSTASAGSSASRCCWTRRPAGRDGRPASAALYTKGPRRTARQAAVSPTARRATRQPIQGCDKGSYGSHWCLLQFGHLVIWSSGYLVFNDRSDDQMTRRLNDQIHCSLLFVEVGDARRLSPSRGTRRGSRAASSCSRGRRTRRAPSPLSSAESSLSTASSRCSGR